MRVYNDAAVGRAVFMAGMAPVGTAPSRPSAPQMVVAFRLLSKFRGWIMRRADAYFAAGCPVATCEWAACLDVIKRLPEVPHSTPSDHADIGAIEKPY